jgi:hypothetical protein
MPLNGLRKHENWVALEKEVRARSKHRKQRVRAELLRQRMKAERQRIRLERERRKEARRELVRRLKWLNATAKIVLGLRR